MNALEECHNRHFLFKALGGCNQLKRDVNKCLSSERGKKSVKNRETGLERRARIEAVWQKMDEGDYSALEEFTKKNS
jgi:COX assembly mitochondrial protein 2